VRKII